MEKFVPLTLVGCRFFFPPEKSKELSRIRGLTRRPSCPSDGFVSLMSITTPALFPNNLCNSAASLSLGFPIYPTTHTFSSSPGEANVGTWQTHFLWEPARRRAACRIAKAKPRTSYCHDPQETQVLVENMKLTSCNQRGGWGQGPHHGLHLLKLQWGSFRVGQPGA